MDDRLQAAEMWFLRRMMRIPWTSHTTNTAVLERAGRQRVFLEAIRKQQLDFLGHCMRKGGLESLFLTGKIAGKRDRGRQRTTYLKSIAAWTGKETIELLRLAMDRNVWHNFMVAYVNGYGT